MTDPIGDLITRIRNVPLGITYVHVNNSRVNRECLTLLFNEGWINGWSVDNTASEKNNNQSRRDLNTRSAAQSANHHSALVEIDEKIAKLTGSATKTKECSAMVPSHNTRSVPSLIVYLKDKAYDGSYGYGSGYGNRKRKTNKLATSKATRLISQLIRLSKPGNRIYVQADDLPSEGLTTYIISTSKGILTTSQARKLGVGGELLFSVS